MFSIENLFKLLNFSLLLGLGWYVIRYYGIIYIVKLMRLEREESQKLYEKKDSRFQEIRQIDNDEDKQKQLFKELQVKFQQWSKVVDSNHEKMVQQADIYMQLIVTRNKQRLLDLQKKQIMRKEMPQIVEEVAVDLKNKFSSSQAGKKYIDSLISFTKE